MPNGQSNFVLPESELEYVSKTLGAGWESLRSGRIFVTGATGFFGCWMVQSLLYANKVMALGISLTLLVRDREKAMQRMPYLEDYESVFLLEGDAVNFVFPEDADFSHVIHLATTASSPTLNIEQPLVMYNTIVKGTEHVMDFCVKSGVQSMLYVSSGAVYGTQPEPCSHVPENSTAGPDPMAADAAYAEGKRTAELLCAIYGRKYAFDVKIARCFAFYGPCMYLDNQHAFGNFIADVLTGRDITIKSDGRSIRSYLYAADLSVWLWQILFRGKSCYPYNVGSENAIDLKELAETIASFSSVSNVTVLGKEGSIVSRYVPSTERGRTELGLKERIDLQEGIRRTLAFFTPLEA